MLTVYLLGIVLGAAIMSFYAKRLKQPILVFAIIQFAIAFDLILLINQFGILPETMYNIRYYLGIGDYGTYGYGVHILSYFISVLQILILPTVLFGASFPLAIKLFVKTCEDLGQETGEPHIYKHGITESEVEEVLMKPGEDRRGREGSRVAIGQTQAGRYIRIIYVPDPEPDSVFVITAYELTGKPLTAYRRRRSRKRARK